MAPPAGICLFPRSDYEKARTLIASLLATGKGPFFYVQVENADHGFQVTRQLSLIHPVEMVLTLGEEMTSAIVDPVQMEICVAGLVLLPFQVEPIKLLALPEVTSDWWNDVNLKIATRSVELIHKCTLEEISEQGFMRLTGREN